MNMMHRVIANGDIWGKRRISITLMNTYLNCGNNNPNNYVYYTYFVKFDCNEHEWYEI